MFCCSVRKDLFLNMRVQIILILYTNYYSFNPTKHCTDLCVRTPVQNNILHRSIDSYAGHKSTQISVQLNVSLLPILILYKCSCSLSFANLEIQFLPVLQISSSIRQLRLQRRCHPACKLLNQLHMNSIDLDELKVSGLHTLLSAGLCFVKFF